MRISILPLLLFVAWPAVAQQSQTNTELAVLRVQLEHAVNAEAQDRQRAESALKAAAASYEARLAEAMRWLRAAQGKAPDGQD